MKPIITVPQENLVDYFNSWIEDIFPSKKVTSVKKIYYTYNGTTPAGSGTTSIASKMQLAPTASGQKGKTFFLGSGQFDSISLAAAGIDYYLFTLTGTNYGDLPFAMYKKNTAAVQVDYQMLKQNIAFDTCSLGSLGSTGLSWIFDGYIIEMN